MINNALIDYTLQLADNTLILAQRNSEWCGHGPVLEQDIAITNISLDLLGQSRSYYQYAAQLINTAAANNSGQTSATNSEQVPATEDSLAYLRTGRNFKNILLTELPNGDWAQTILRQFFFSAWQYLLYEKLQQSKDETLAAIAEKSLKEVTYHLRWSSEWVIRLGDGTPESHERMEEAVKELWSYTGESFIPVACETAMAAQQIAPDITTLQQAWYNKVDDIFQEATLETPAPDAWMQTGGKTGIHTEHLDFILAEMQHLQRVYPGVEW